MMKTNENNAPDNLEALLPWHAAGTLNRRDADVVERALAQDAELARHFAMVREEMTETILLNEALGALFCHVKGRVKPEESNGSVVSEQFANLRK